MIKPDGRVSVPLDPRITPGMRFVEPAEISAKTGGETLLGLLVDTLLCICADTAGNYWAGPVSGEIHEHERWLYMIPASELADTDDWYATRFRMLTGCAGEYLNMKSSFLDELEDMDNRGFRTRVLVDAKTKHEDGQIRHACLLVQRNLGYLPVRLLQLAVKVPWTPATHEVLYHYEDWMLEHKAEDLPQNLALRLIGFGPYLNALSPREKQLHRVQL